MNSFRFVSFWGSRRSVAVSKKYIVCSLKSPYFLHLKNKLMESFSVRAHEQAHIYVYQNKIFAIVTMYMKICAISYNICFIY